MSNLAKLGTNQTTFGTLPSKLQLPLPPPLQTTHLMSHITRLISLWHSLYFAFSVNIAQNENFLKTGVWPYLSVDSAGHALHVFVNGKYAG